MSAPLAFAAARVFDGLGAELANHAVILDPQTRRIQALRPAAEIPNAKWVEGALAPGFINAHGHLELSHLQGQFARDTGLVPFLEAVTKQRAASPERIAEAMREAHNAMQQAGIVGMGDITNTADSLPIKRESSLRWHQFVEVFGASEAGAASGLARGLPVRQAFREAGLTADTSPHAPYSVHPELLGALGEQADGRLMSIHMQESPAEMQWFQEGKGPFEAFFAGLGIPVTAPTPGNSPLRTVLEALPQGPLLLVHNTLATAEDRALAAARPDTWWCFCPLANLYIEERLPDVPTWLPHTDRVVIGTDSLASNKRLSVHDELAALAQAFPAIPEATLLQWACGNGARLFGWEADLGALEPGRAPALLQLRPSAEGQLFGPGSEVQVLVQPGV